MTSTKIWQRGDKCYTNIASQQVAVLVLESAVTPYPALLKIAVKNSLSGQWLTTVLKSQTPFSRLIGRDNVIPGLDYE